MKIKTFSNMTLSRLLSSMWLIACSTSASTVAVTTPGCGSDSAKSLGIGSTAKLSVQINNKVAPKSPTCTNFAPDETRGQVAKHQQIYIRNEAADVGATPSVLCLKWDASKSNTQLKVSVVSGLKKDDTACTDRGYPGMMAALGVNGSPLVLDVEYRGNESGDTAPLTLTITSNSEQPVKGGTTTTKICFGIATTGAQCELTPTEYSFINASKANPPSACFTLKNKGTAPCTFQGADMDPANAQYQIIKQPNASDVIPPKGDPGNPDGEKSLEICLRYTPDDTADNEDLTLSVSTSNKSGALKALITAKTQEEAKWTVDCSDPSGKIGFVFADASKGETKKCKIINQGPPPLKVVDVKAESVSPNDRDKVDAVIKCQLVDINGAPQNPYSINPGKSADLVCTYAPKDATKPPPANCNFTYSSANGPSGKMSLPIQVGGCDQPAPEFGPSPELWLMAKAGETSNGTVTVANQSCAGMQLVTACIASASYKGTEPCQAPSKNMALVTPFSPTAVPAFGAVNLDVQFAPDSKATVKQTQDLLHVSYCAGIWAGGQCSGTIVERALNLVGFVDFDGKIVAPTTACSLVSDPAKLVKGQPVTIQQVVKGGPTFADNQQFYYRWHVSKRPAGAGSWLPEELQSTDKTNTVKILPDAAGDYEVTCQVQGINGENPNIYAWSSQAKVAFTVK